MIGGGGGGGAWVVVCAPLSVHLQLSAPFPALAARDARGRRWVASHQLKIAKKILFVSSFHCNKGEKCLFRHVIDQGICNEKKARIE
jgi:hypothetical protein